MEKSLIYHLAWNDAVNVRHAVNHFVHSTSKLLFGEQFHSLYANIKFNHSHTKKQGEFDVVLLNGTAAAIIEVKFKARKGDYQQLLNQVASFRDEFPQYKSHRIYLGMAALTFEDHVEEECKREGIAVFKQDGDNVVIYDENLKTFWWYDTTRRVKCAAANERLCVSAESVVEK